MKGFIARSLAGSAIVGGLAATSGCYNQGKCVDPCYPERYVYQAKTSVTAAFAPQVQNGHILDQTLWNYFFEVGKDELNASGRDQIDALMRRRPHPDARVYLATARDVAYDSLNPEKSVETRRELDEKRAAAVQKYMQSQTAGRPMQFEIVVHDPVEVGQHAYPVNRSVLLNHNITSGSALTSSSASTAGQGQGQGGGGAGMGQNNGGSSGGSGNSSGGGSGGSR